MNEKMNEHVCLILGSVNASIMDTAATVKITDLDIYAKVDVTGKKKKERKNKMIIIKK